MEKNKTIYHIVAAGDLAKCTSKGMYTPVGFTDDGFIHCTGEPDTCLLVLEDYFSRFPEEETLLVLEIETGKVTADVRFEDPAPIAGAGKSHLGQGVLFPHIYGELNVDAVSRAGRVIRKNGRYIWPEEFSPVGRYL
ncbi:MAG: DUF952 domain-containing protein [Spirochaetales bacterium]|nr:DUF952 domain-containing protein [Spirochaetales bacterium]